MDLTTPPPEPAVHRSYHMHDGFYARVSLGVGSLRARFDDDSASGDDLHLSSGAFGSLGFDVMLGGSPAPGVAIGGALLVSGTGSAETERGDFLAGDRGSSLVLLGPFIDGFPKANRGWHFGGMLGAANLQVQKSSLDRVHTNRGVGGAFWLGHDFWVADDWSVGPLVRFSGAVTRDRDADVSASAFSAMILFTGLYH